MTINHKPKILLASTINVVKEYCLFDWLDHIKKLTYPELDIFLVDNSQNPYFCEKIKSLGFNCVWEDPKGRENRFFMASSNERCRIKFLAGDYTHFFSLECDIFPPLDIIERLLAHDKDICGTTYWIYQGYDAKLCLQKQVLLHSNIKTKTKQYKAIELTFAEAQLFMDGTCKPIYANGIGCTLIKRWILEQISFRVDNSDIGHADSFFYQDIWRNGIENYVDTSIIPKHRNSNWSTVLSDTEHKKLMLKKGELKLKR